MIDFDKRRAIEQKARGRLAEIRGKVMERMMPTLTEGQLRALDDPRVFDALVKRIGAERVQMLIKKSGVQSPESGVRSLKEGG